jgi:hypothetical protein
LNGCVRSSPSASASFAEQAKRIADLERQLALRQQNWTTTFFTFVHEAGVEPTNNAAERGLRTAVQWRKIMFGTRSEQGERAVERLRAEIHPRGPRARCQGRRGAADSAERRACGGGGRRHGAINVVSPVRQDWIDKTDTYFRE